MKFKHAQALQPGDRIILATETGREVWQVTGQPHRSMLFSFLVKVPNRRVSDEATETISLYTNPRMAPADDTAPSNNTKSCTS